MNLFCQIELLIHSLQLSVVRLPFTKPPIPVHRGYSFSCCFFEKSHLFLSPERLAQNGDKTLKNTGFEAQQADLSHSRLKTNSLQK